MIYNNKTDNNYVVNNKETAQNNNVCYADIADHPIRKKIITPPEQAYFSRTDD